MSDRQKNILCAGISWPPETFLARLIKGLADEGANVTVACKKKPADDWLAHPRLHWLCTPDWDVAAPARIFKLMWMASRGVITARDDINSFKAHINVLENRLERLRMWYQLLPFGVIAGTSSTFPGILLPSITWRYLI